MSGPGPASFADPASAATMATLSVAGTYVLRLSATDGSLSSSDDVTVLLETENEPPVVSAGPDARVFSLYTEVQVKSLARVIERSHPRERVE